MIEFKLTANSDIIFLGVVNQLLNPSIEAVMTCRILYMPYIPPLCLYEECYSLSTKLYLKIVSYNAGRERKSIWNYQLIDTELTGLHVSGQMPLPIRTTP